MKTREGRLVEKMQFNKVSGSLEGELLHEQVHVLVHLEAVQVVGVSLQPHEQSSEGHEGGPATERERYRTGPTDRRTDKDGQWKTRSWVRTCEKAPRLASAGRKAVQIVAVTPSTQPANHTATAARVRPARRGQPSLGHRTYLPFLFYLFILVPWKPRTEIPWVVRCRAATSQHRAYSA